MINWTKPLDSGLFEANTYILYDPDKMISLIIDPAGSEEAIYDAIDQTGTTPMAIILTHGHFDHISALDDVRAKYDIPAMIHSEDAEMLTNAALNLSMMMGGGFTTRPAEKLVSDGDVIELGSEKIRIMHTPGHTKGGISLYSDGIAVTGDALFSGSVGRTDFPGGDHAALVRSIREKLLTLPEDTVVLPGHGETTTVLDEKQFNPFL